MNAAIDLQLVLSALTLVGVLGLWWYVSRHTARVDQLDRRVIALEERVSGMPAVRQQLDALSSAVAAIDERTRATVTAMHSIQDYLRNRE